MIQKHCLLTPPLTDGVLPGITRARIFKLSEQLNINCIEASLTKSMLKDADVVFLVNSLQGIRPAYSLDDMIFAIDHPLLDQFTSSLSVGSTI